MTPASSSPEQHAASAHGATDAVCFTAGASGVPFAAGVVHAYLAADRPAPVVAAGISTGALSAAAMQRVYRELADAQVDPGATPGGVEAARWEWFRRYVTVLTDTPLNALWDGLPDQADFVAELPPVRDATTPDERRPLEREAFRRRHLLVKLGQWLAGVPLTVRLVATLIVTHVRYREQYGSRALPRALEYYWALIRVVTRLGWHLAWHPCRLRWRDFPERGRLASLRPLFGYDAFIAAWALIVAGVVGIASFLFWSWWLLRGPGLDHASPVMAVAAVAALVVVGWVLAAFTPRRLAAWRRRVFACLEINRGLIDSFHLAERLRRLYQTRDGGDPIVGDGPVALVAVAAPLQTLQTADGKPLVAYQSWAGSDIPVREAVEAALTLPPLFAPVRVSSADARRWLPPDVSGVKDGIDLVDASVIRQNPLPSLFDFLRARPELAARLERQTDAADHATASVHVVYNVPITAKSGFRKLPEEESNIVDVALKSVALSQRRDTQLEVRQSNFISHLEAQVRTLAGPSATSSAPGVSAPTLKLFTDEIAPAEDLSFGNPLNPSATEMFDAIAAGCRQTLQTLYARELAALPSDSASPGCVSCAALMGRVRRQPAFPRPTPGLPEVCERCTQQLPRPATAHATSDATSFTIKATDLKVADFPGLSGEAPRVIFVASGGVFRGAFHVGVLGALLQLQIRPQLVVGTSVGTLMGGVLAAIFTRPTTSEAQRCLHTLVQVSLDVDTEIALTRRLKAALRELGVRSQSIGLSPPQIRRAVQRGSRSDPGYAAAGAPPILIDAISSLFLLPHRVTADIAANFMAGHVTDATQQFLRALKSETLWRLDVEQALVGSALLERAAAKLLLVDGLIAQRRPRQPFIGVPPRADGIAFFATTTDLGTETPLLLGDSSRCPDAPYDLIEAALASSAFPLVFAPRRESDVFPGHGRRDVRLADGGMFDNVPFLPAIEVLGAIQRDHAATHPGLVPIEFLATRHRNPDLFIAAALDVNPETSSPEHFDDLVAIGNRAGSLQNNVKIRAFERGTTRIHAQIERLLRAPAATTARLDPGFLNGIVDAGVLPIFPADDQHLNPTYAFCRTLGLTRERVLRSIANGCFQSFATLADMQRPAEQSVAATSVQNLVRLKRLPRVDVTANPAVQPPTCPYFRVDPVGAGAWAAVTCPFAASTAGDASLGVYETCTADALHRRERAARSS
jgi:predicted acylesterase/phospholipase RssA